MCFISMYTVLNTLSEYTYFYISKSITSYTFVACFYDLWKPSVLDVYHVIKRFNLCSWLLSYDHSKIFAKLVMPLKHNKILARFLKILLGNNITSSHTHICWKNKSLSEVVTYIFRFFIKGTIFKNALEKFNMPRF